MGGAWRWAYGLCPLDERVAPELALGDTVSWSLVGDVIPGTPRLRAAAERVLPMPDASARVRGRRNPWPRRLCLRFCSVGDTLDWRSGGGVLDDVGLFSSAYAVRLGCELWRSIAASGRISW